MVVPPGLLQIASRSPPYCDFPVFVRLFAVGSLFLIELGILVNKVGEIVVFVLGILSLKVMVGVYKEPPSLSILTDWCFNRASHGAEGSCHC
jgi:hypothetical protein